MRSSAPAPARRTSRTVTASEAKTLRIECSDLREAGQRAHAEGRLSDEQLERLEDLCRERQLEKRAPSDGSTVDVADDEILDVLDLDSMEFEWVEVPFPSSGLDDGHADWRSRDALPKASLALSERSAEWLADDALQVSSSGVTSLPIGARSAEWLAEDALVASTSGVASLPSPPIGERSAVWLADDALSDSTSAVMTRPVAGGSAPWTANEVLSPPAFEVDSSAVTTHRLEESVTHGSDEAWARARSSIPRSPPPDPWGIAPSVIQPSSRGDGITLPPPRAAAPAASPLHPSPVASASPAFSRSHSSPFAPHMGNGDLRGGSTLLSAQPVIVTPTRAFVPLHAGTKLRLPLADSVELLRRAEAESPKTSPMAPFVFLAALVLGLVGLVVLSRRCPPCPAQPTVTMVSATPATTARAHVVPAIAVVSTPPPASRTAPR